MERAWFSPSQLIFIPELWKTDGTYDDAGWPQDAVLLTEEETASYWKKNPPAGKRLGVLKKRPAWVDIAPPTTEETIVAVAAEKARRIEESNSLINEKQWPSRLAFGRLSEAEKQLFNRWLDYQDAVNAADPLSPAWPEVPEDVA